MNPPSKPQRFRPSSDSLKEIRKFSPVKTIGKNTQETKESIRKGMKLAPNIGSAGTDRERLVKQLVSTTKAYQFSNALSIENPEEQRQVLEGILEELDNGDLECHKDVLDGVYDTLRLEDSASKIKDREHLQEFCIKFIATYSYRYYSDELIEKIYKLKINQKVWYEIATCKCSDDGKAHALQAALQITDKEKQQEAFFIIATKGLSVFDRAHEDECSAVLNAALKITDEEKRSAALYALGDPKYMPEMFEAALEVTEANHKDDILFQFACRLLHDLRQPEYNPVSSIIIKVARNITIVEDQQNIFLRIAQIPLFLIQRGFKIENINCQEVWLKAASFLTDGREAFELLSKCSGGYGLKKRLESLPVDPQLRKEKLKAMFAYPISSNADDQEALLKIHQQLCVKAQSLDEQIDWAFNKTHDFSTVYANPELLPSVCLDHLLCINDIQKQILCCLSSKPSGTLFQQNYEAQWLSSIGKIVNVQLGIYRNLRIMGLKRLCILRDQQDQLLNGLRRVVMNGKTTAPPVDVKENILENDPITVDFYQKITDFLESNIWSEKLKSIFNFKNPDADTTMKVLEAYDRHMISKNIEPKIRQLETLSYGISFVGDNHENYDSKFKEIVEYYLMADTEGLEIRLDEIVKLILQSDTLSNALKVKTIELLYDINRRYIFELVDGNPENNRYRSQFQTFFRQLDPEVSTETLEMFSSPLSIEDPITGRVRYAEFSAPVLRQYIRYTLKQDLIERLKSIPDQGKFQRTKLAAREDNAL